MNLLPRLSPDPAAVRLETWAIEPARSAITLTLRPRSRTARCPLCGRRSGRVHSRYERTLADLPWGDYAVLIRLRARRLCNHQAAISRKAGSFRERELARQACGTLGRAAGGGRDMTRTCGGERGR